MVRWFITSIFFTAVQLFLAPQSKAADVPKYECADLINHPDAITVTVKNGFVSSVEVQRSSDKRTFYIRTDRDIKFVAGTYDMKIDEFLRYFKGKILDAGAGDGSFVNEMQVLGYDVVGADIYLTPFQQTQPTIFFRQDIAHLKWPDNTFDRIISTYSVLTYELRNASAPAEPVSMRVLQEFKRVLKPGGIILLSPVPDSGVMESMLANIKGLVIEKKTQYPANSRESGYILRKSEGE